MLFKIKSFYNAVSCRDLIVPQHDKLFKLGFKINFKKLKTIFNGNHFRCIKQTFNTIVFVLSMNLLMLFI